MSQQEQADDDMKHLKPVVIQYLSQLPMGPSKSEPLFMVMCSLLNIEPKDQAGLKTQREALTAQALKDSAKKGVFGMFGGQKKWVLVNW